ncbi:unnamed protein product [Penicillium nalgiovense]|nr:unnamed protein product [Penicillium nalgiovense]
MYIPQEIIDLITFYIEIDTSQYSSRTSTARAFRITNDKSRKNLAQLRLVNKSFCHSASTRLFQHITAIAHSSYDTAQLPSLGRLLNLSKSPYAQYVRQVDIGYGPFPCSIREVSLYTEDLAALLSSCLRQFHNLKRLDFRGPPLALLSHDKLKASIDSILMSLCYVPLPNLTELEIQLPMTNDFAPLFAENISTLRIPIEQTLGRLQYLGLHVYAQTNQQSCAAHLLRIVELSTNLTSLSVSSTNYLSIDRLELDSTVHLRFLSLHKVRISSRTLVNIIEKCNESMQYIELKHVKIESGAWTEILSAMDSLPYLYDFDISVGETFIGSERFHPAPTLFFTAENVQDRGPFGLDHSAFQNLKRRVKLKRAVPRHCNC